MSQGELNTKLLALSPRTGADLDQLQEGLGWFWGVKCPWDVISQKSLCSVGTESCLTSCSALGIQERGKRSRSNTREPKCVST